LSHVYMIEGTYIIYIFTDVAKTKDNLIHTVFDVVSQKKSIYMNLCYIYAIFSLIFFVKS
jgi:hypothetical protein